MPDTSTPSPSDPDSSGKESPSIPEAGKKLSGKEKPRLKLKRLVIKDTKINPHINPEAEPVPHAEPISEPEPEPVPEDMVDRTNSPAPEMQVPEEPAPPQKLKMKSSETEETQKPETDPEEKAEAEVPSKEAPTKPDPKKKRKKKLWFPLLLILGSLAYGIHVIFDPLGLKPEPIAPVDVPIRTAAEPSDPIPETDAPALAISNNLQEGTHIDLQEYLDKLARQELKISENPRGIYINKVFYAENMPLNPSLGLIVQSISDEGEPPAFTVVDPDGNSFPIRIP